MDYEDIKEGEYSDLEIKKKIDENKKIEIIYKKNGQTFLFSFIDFSNLSVHRSLSFDNIEDHQKTKEKVIKKVLNELIENAEFDENKKTEQFEIPANTNKIVFKGILVDSKKIRIELIK